MGTSGVEPEYPDTGLKPAADGPAKCGPGFFSFDPEKVRFALNHYQMRMDDGSTVINQLLQKYSLEGMDMPYTMEQFRKEYIKAHLKELDPDEVLSKFDPAERLKGLKMEEIEAYLEKLKKQRKH